MTVSNITTDSSDHFRKRKVAETEYLQNFRQHNESVASGMLVVKPDASVTRQGENRVTFDE